MIRLGIIGCGAIGTSIATAVDRGEVKNCELAAVFDVDVKQINKFLSKLSSKPKIASAFEDFLKIDSDLIAECASQKALKQYAEKILKSGRDMLVMSEGAFLDDDFNKRVLKVVSETGRKIHLPSGAIGGLDVMKAAARSGLKNVRLVTRKPPDSLGGKDGRIRTVFEGSAEEAVKLLPANINIAATLSLAGIGGKKTKVKVISDPRIKLIIHRLEVSGGFGRMALALYNVPHPDNPKTSALAVYSAIVTLQQLCSPDVRIGT
ncbi:MAG: aspartate dehydrogenase [Thaumarchaeota archaeon]|nr:aspartate dehydrogenase [Nitrososphaerota archaeon]